MVSVFVLPLLLSATSPALAAAHAAYGAVDYARCRQEARSALVSPAGQGERVETYRLLGLCLAAEGDTDAARDAFRAMLLFDREARLPAGLSPRFTSSFLEAKGSLVDTPLLSLTVASEEVNDGVRRVRLGVKDAEDMIAKLAWSSEGGVLSSPVARAPLVEFVVTASAPVRFVALDAHDGWVTALELPARSTENGGDPLDDDDAARAQVVAPQALPWGVIGVAAGVVAAVGVGIGVAVAVAPREATLVPQVAFAP